MSGDDWVPAQERQPQAVDFRRYTTQPKGYKERNKRKLDDDYEAAAAAADAEPAVMELDGGEDAQQTVPAGKRRKAEGVAYIPVYEKKAGIAKPERSSRTMRHVHKTSWERKMQEKAGKKQFSEIKAAALADRKAAKRADAEHRRSVKEKKAAARERSAVVQPVSSATAKRMMKNRKQKRLLKTADTNPKPK
uniref:Coiled-coil domain-containing protein 86 n=1 Tax=Chlamydomonas euryale TaxID=1486919 RepID=A0A7R9V9I8_9CHLO|mmetsp:Transcript_2642/g.7140  ORF Transcript_2642/g.7140 Transcript_2642/m.7140 type:complete len:192 (+) Transcript_2642:283-858(+)